MRGVTLHEELAQIEFAKAAADAFAKNAQLATFAENELGSGCYLAIRWGLGGDCVMVCKLDEFHEPTNYHQLVKVKS